MTTTIMRDSIVGDDWIRQNCASIPVHRHLDPKTNQPSGVIITGPVRLTFENIWEPPKPRIGDEPGKVYKYGSEILFTPLADFTIFNEEYWKACHVHFPENYDAGTQQFSGLHSPFHRQDDKLKHGGFTPGCVSIASTSKFKPLIVDTRFNPIVDRNKVYSGVWAICGVNPYSYGKGQALKKKGIGFGLQSVMIIGDDSRLGKKGPDAKSHFGGLNVAAPIVRPEMVAGMPMGAPQGGAPAYAPPPVPQQHFSMPPSAVPPMAPASEDDDWSFLN